MYSPLKLGFNPLIPRTAEGMKGLGSSKNRSRIHMNGMWGKKITSKFNLHLDLSWLPGLQKTCFNVVMEKPRENETSVEQLLYQTTCLYSPPLPRLHEYFPKDKYRHMNSFNGINVKILNFPQIFFPKFDLPKYTHALGSNFFTSSSTVTLLPPFLIFLWAVVSQ